ncbi:virulence associated lipoprotein [Borrelia duttonii]|uniref:Uncharacterized conserved protein n=1 Tax=Borrelia duttonii (strain Ly) TaxID=412419 RepID=B5RN78_BORDL|nr:uncharacterized conserved protein [Borrelia duttonii Ly]
MKRKDFILFVIFVFILILLLLLSCGPKKKYAPVSSAVRRNRLGPNGVTGGTNTNGVTVGSQGGTGAGGSQGGTGAVGSQGGTGAVDNEQILKQKEIKDIKIPDKVSQILKTRDNENWDEDAAGYNLKGANQLFSRVKYKVASGDEFLYNDATDDKRAKESKALRREFYLACEYNANFIKAFAGVVNKLVATDELAAKNKAELEQFVENVRFYALFYYNAYSILKEKQSKLDVLTLKKLQSLKTAFLLLEKEQQELYDVIQLIINDYNNDTSINSSEPTHNLKSIDTLPSEIIEYWKKDTLRGDFNRKCGNIINTAIMILNLLKDI